MIWGLYLFFIESEESNGDASIIYIDNSISNSIVINERSTLDEIKKVTDEIVDGSPSLVLLSNSNLGLDNVANQYENISNEISSLNYSYDQLPAQIITDRIIRSQHKNKYFFSDMQGFYTEGLSDTKIDSASKYFFIVTDFIEKRNAFIDTVFVGKNKNDFNSLLLSIEVATSLNFNEGNIVVKLFSKNKQLSSVVYRIEEKGNIQFDIPVLYDLDYRIVISGDDIEFDNQFFFSLDKIRKPKVSLISNQKYSYTNSVFQNDELFDFNSMNSSSIKFPILQASDLIIVDDLSSIPNGIVSQFNQSFILIFPSDSLSNLIEFNDFGFSLVKSSDLNQYRSILNPDNELFAGVFDKKILNSVMPIGTSFYSFKGAYVPVIKLSSGSTFLAKSSVGNIYMLSSPLGEPYTNLPIHSIFLPMMYKFAFNSAQKESSKLCYYAGDLMKIRALFSDIPIRFVGNNYEQIPESSYLKDEVIVRIPSAMAPGFYTILQGYDTLGKIAVNLPRSESIVEKLRAEELNEYFSDVDHVTVLKLEEDLTFKDIHQETTYSLWKIALVLVVFFALTETMLHRYLK